MQDIRLVDVVKQLLIDKNIKGNEGSQRWGVNRTWVYYFTTGRIKNPSADLAQTIYEDLTGERLLDKKPPSA